MNKPKYFELDYHNLRNQGTGGQVDLDSLKVVTYPIGDFEVKVVITSDNKFVGILEVSASRDFRNLQQRLSNLGFHDVEGYYKED